MIPPVILVDSTVQTVNKSKHKRDYWKLKRDILWRVYLCFVGIVVFSLVILGRVFYIQQMQGNYWKDAGPATATEVH